MPRFIPYDYQQDTMVVINFDDQILPGTFEHALHYLIEHKVDLSAFHAAHSMVLSEQYHIQGALVRHQSGLHNHCSLCQWPFGGDKQSVRTSRIDLP